MTKATRIINEYHIKEMLLNGNPQFENFYKEELISFCEIAKEIIQNQQQENKKYKEVIDNLKAYLKLNIELIREQPSNDELTDNFILVRFKSLLDYLKEV